MCQLCGVTLPLGWYKMPPRESLPSHQLAHDSLIRESRSEMAGLIEDYAQNRITAEQWYARMDALIRLMHTRAYMIGTEQGGLMATLEAAQEVGNIIGDQESGYLLGFKRRLEEGDRYFDAEGELNLEHGHLNGDLDLYATKASGTANAGFTVASPAGSEFEWRLGASEHCEDCLYLAGLSPYRQNTVSYTPRSGDTRCLSNCKCSWIRTDGVTGFAPVEL